MHLAINTMSFKRFLKRHGNDPIHILPVVTDFPVDGIELFDLHARTHIQQFVPAARDLGVEVFSLAIHNAYHVSGPRVEKMKRYVENWCKVADEADVHIIRTFIDDLMRPAPSLLFRTARMMLKASRQVIPMIKETVNLARDHGISVGIENHWGYSSDPSFLYQVDDAMQDVDGFGWIYDAGNWPGNVDRYSVLKRLLPRVIYVHAKSKAFTGDERVKGIDYPRIFKILSGGNFKGYLSVEYEGKMDEKEGVTRTIAELTSCMKLK